MFNVNGKVVYGNMLMVENMKFVFCTELIKVLLKF